MKSLLKFVLISVLCAGAFPVVAADEAVTATSTTGTAESKPEALDPNKYPLEICIVSGEKLGVMGEPVTQTYDGREIKFCCKQCIKGFEKDQAGWLKKVDAAIIEAQKTTYPLTTCVVSDEKLGSMGDPVEYVYGNQLVRFCCKGCIATFEKEPTKYWDKITQARDAAAKPASVEAKE